MSNRHTDDVYLETDAEVDRATGPAAAAVIDALAKALRDAPDDQRFDVAVTVRECDDEIE